MGSGVRRDDAVCGAFAFHKKTVVVRHDRTIQYAATSRLSLAALEYWIPA
jgi:hypothetical protein